MKTIFQQLFFCASLLLCVSFLGCIESSSNAFVAVAMQDQVAEGQKSKKEAVASPDGQSKVGQEKDDSTKSAKPATPAKAGMAGMGKMKFPAPKDMKFKDSVESNAKAPMKVEDLVFITKDGSKIKLGNYAGQKNILLVFTEGFNGMLCPFCTTQTSRLVANYDKFKERDCEVIVVYPGPEDRLQDFIQAALKIEKDQVDRVPFPIVLDEDFAATDFFDIHSKFAHPSTYLIDKQGSVQFAYVGNDMTADRPSIKAMLERLDQLEK